MNIDVDFLQYIIKNRGFTMEDFVSKLTMSKTTFYKKMSNPLSFTFYEFAEMHSILKFTKKEVVAIIFKNAVND